MNPFKVGDKVKKIRGNCQSAYDGEIYTVVFDKKENMIACGSNPNDLCHCPKEWELITTSTTDMNIMEKFALAFKSEPEKSFRKAGITNGDDLLTENGQKIFLSWLLKKQGADFKKEVVDDLLKEEESK